jgi:hypothetical protein
MVMWGLWQGCEPDLLIALHPPISYILATIIDPDPLLGPVEEQDRQHEIHEEEDHISFGVWLITANRSGIGVRASYPYLICRGV